MKLDPLSKLQIHVHSFQNGVRPESILQGISCTRYLVSSLGGGEVQRKVVLLPVCPCEDGQRMRFGVEHPLVEREKILFREEKVEVFEPDLKSQWSVNDSVAARTRIMRMCRQDVRLSEEETRHLVLICWRDLVDVLDGRVRLTRPRLFLYCLENSPSALLPLRVASNPPHVEDTLDGLRPPLEASFPSHLTGGLACVCQKQPTSCAMACEQKFVDAGDSRRAPSSFCRRKRFVSSGW